MRKYNLFAAVYVMLLLLAFAGTAQAQYWFQSGAKASSSSSRNIGTSIAIQTVYQNVSIGSLGFWVGEDVANGAFIQVGYEIPNVTGYYTSPCLNSSTGVYLKAGVPTWFWEYFLSGQPSNNFCGGIGQVGSVGKNGDWNVYALKSNGNVWTAYMNNRSLGSIDLGVSTSGPYSPSGLAEYADTDSNIYPMKNVSFKDMRYFVGNTTKPVPEAYTSIGYGKGSLQALKNTFGVVEQGGLADYFTVGSTITPVPRAAFLWKIGYSLNVVSDYGNITGIQNYIAYSFATLSAPRIVNVSPGTRAMFVGWIGTGQNSYTGSSPTVNISMSSNITEKALWKTQYFVNVSSSYGGIVGGGWYDANSVATLYLGSNIVSISQGSRAVFTGWSNNAVTKNITLVVNGPKTAGPVWKTQYYVNASSQYGSVLGNGWYDIGSTANLNLSTDTVTINQTQRYRFTRWSNGSLSRNISFSVRNPVSLSALFEKQYLVRIAVQNSDGQNLTNIGYFNVSSSLIASNSLFLYPGRVYTLEYIYYKNVTVVTNQKFSVTQPTTIALKVPVYNLTISARSVFGTPVNASLNITFKNKTRINTYLGANGILNLYNVPYGYVAGYAEYFGVRQNVDTTNNYGKYLTFVDAGLVSLIVFGIIIIVIIAKVASVYENRRK